MTCKAINGICAKLLDETKRSRPDTKSNAPTPRRIYCDETQTRPETHGPRPRRDRDETLISTSQDRLKTETSCLQIVITLLFR